MSGGVPDLLQEKVRLFDPFSRVYLFGSALFSRQAADIDILLIYDEYSPDEVAEYVDSVDKQLSPFLNGVPTHFTILSEDELAETGFLARISYLKIKA